MIRDPDRLVGEIAMVGMAFALLWRVFVRFWQVPVSPDPWGQDVESALKEPDAREVCHRCFNPVTPGFWFCEHCGSSVGPYNNLMPYIVIFPQGEVLRNGLTDKVRRNVFTVVAYIFVSFNFCGPAALIYWILLFRSLKRRGEPAELMEAS